MIESTIRPDADVWIVDQLHSVATLRAFAPGGWELSFIGIKGFTELGVKYRFVQETPRLLRHWGPVTGQWSYTIDLNKY